MDPAVAAALEAIGHGTLASELESSTLEFKEDSGDTRRTLDSLADAVVCLANADGGTVVTGVANSPGGPSALVGVPLRLTVEAVARGIFDRTRPGLSVPIEEIVESGVRLLVITVPRGVVFYSNSSGTATRRLGSTCVPFTPEQQLQAAAARGHMDWSSEPSGAHLGDLAPEELVRMRRLLGLAGRDDLASADNQKLLRDIRLLSQDDEVTRAGLLLLGREDSLSRHIPTYGYAYQYRPTLGSESTARFRGNRPLLAAVELLLEAVGVRTQIHSISAEGGVQLQILDYPRDAVRELVVNAFVHRDYEFQAAIEIEHSPESLAVTSPGGLVYGVTPDNILTHPSTPRHRLLLDTITLLQVAERTGQGIDRAYRELLRVGKKPPQIADDGLQVRVLVPGGAGNDAFARFVAGLDSALGRDVDALLALSRLREQRSIDAKELSGAVQRSYVDAQSVLERLAHGGLLDPTRKTARRDFPSYALTSDALTGLGRAVRYHFRRTDEADKKVAAHVREYGHVTNQTLRRLFDIDVFAARDLLRDLQQRQVLRKLDPARAGRGIRYGPGARLPATADGRARLAQPKPSHADSQSAAQLPLDGLEGIDDDG